VEVGSDGLGLGEVRPKALLESVERGLRRWNDPSRNRSEDYMVTLTFFAPTIFYAAFEYADANRHNSPRFILNAHRCLLQITNHWRRCHAAYNQLASTSSTSGLRPLVQGKVSGTRTLIIPTEAEIDALPQVAALHYLIERVPDTELDAQVKRDLKRAINAIWGLRSLLLRQETCNGENNLGMLYTLIFLADLSDAFYDRFPIMSNLSDLHPIWQAILCHWAYVCHRARSEVQSQQAGVEDGVDCWFLRNVGKYLCQEFFETHTGLWQDLAWKTAMEVVFDAVGDGNDFAMRV
jgi:hypothetical protein